MIDFLLGLGRSAAIIAAGTGLFVGATHLIIWSSDRPYRRLGKGRWA